MLPDTSAAAIAASGLLQLAGLTPDRLKGHAAGFQDFVGDYQALLAAFETRLPRPWIALGHSMGGCLTSLVLAHGETRFSACVLSAPMLGLNTGGKPAGMARASITFLVDADGILRVTAREETTGQEAHVEVKPSYGLTDEEVRKVIDCNYARAKSILETHIDKLHAMADALIKYETIGDDQPSPGILAAHSMFALFDHCSGSPVWLADGLD